MKQIEVVIAAIVRQRQIYLTRRYQEAHQGGCWELPGGKVEAGEAVAQALCRELLEECGIRPQQYQCWKVFTYDYPDRQLTLHIYWVSEFSGEPEANAAIEGRWFGADELAALQWPEANRGFIGALAESLRRC